MKLFFITSEFSELAEPKSTILEKTKKALLQLEFVEEVVNPDFADALIIQEKWAYKDFRHTQIVLNDPFLSKYISKVFTLNFDDCATGLLPGLYTSISTQRLNSDLHAAVPYMEYFNEFVFSKNYEKTEPAYLASWRGNSLSNTLRPKMIKHLISNSDCRLELTDSWQNHSSGEKNDYINLILNSQFSLCPAGWSPPSLRIYESMALGKCPVIISDYFAPPIGPNWDDFAIIYPENKIKHLHHFLTQHAASAEQLGSRARIAWETYFRPEILPGYYADSLIKIIRGPVGSTKESLVNRWNSHNFYWSNKWTLPQRISSKISRLVKIK